MPIVEVSDDVEPEFIDELRLPEELGDDMVPLEFVLDDPDVPEPIVFGLALFMFEPEAPPVELDVVPAPPCEVLEPLVPPWEVLELPVPPCDEPVEPLVAELPVEPEVPPAPCAAAMPVPRASAKAAARVSVRGCLLMMSVLLQVQGKRPAGRFAR